MSQNGNGAADQHYCTQSRRLLRIELNLSELEARRRDDVAKTMDVLKGMVGQLNTALEFFTTAKKQIKMLYAKVGELTRELERQRRRNSRQMRHYNGKGTR